MASVLRLSSEDHAFPPPVAKLSDATHLAKVTGCYNCLLCVRTARSRLSNHSRFSLSLSAYIKMLRAKRGKEDCTELDGTS